MRRSVNKNITKPLQHVLSGKQIFWQVSLLSTHSEPKCQYKQGADVTDNRKAEKWSSLDIPQHRHPASESEVFGSAEPPNATPEPQNEFVRATLYYDREADTIHCCPGHHHAFRVISYHTSSGQENELKDGGDSSNCTTGIINDSLKEEGLNRFEPPKTYSTLNEYDERIKKFTEGVTSQIKQGTYISNPNFTYKPLNIDDHLTHNCDQTHSNNVEVENEYVRAILNGIPCKNKNYHAKLNTQNADSEKHSSQQSSHLKSAEEDDRKQNEIPYEGSSKASEDPLERPPSADLSNQRETIEQDERQPYLELCKNNSRQRFQKNFNMSPREEMNKQHREDYREKLKYQNKKFKFTRMGEEFRSPSYSLRNGFEEKDILKVDNISQNRFHKPAESESRANLHYQPIQADRSNAFQTEPPEMCSPVKSTKTKNANHKEHKNPEANQIEKEKTYRTYHKQTFKSDLVIRAIKKSNARSEKVKKFSKPADKSYQLAKPKGTNSSYDVLKNESVFIRQADLSSNNANNPAFSMRVENIKEKGNHAQDLKTPPPPQSFSDCDNNPKVNMRVEHMNEQGNCTQDMKTTLAQSSIDSDNNPKVNMKIGNINEKDEKENCTQDLKTILPQSSIDSDNNPKVSTRVENVNEIGNYTHDMKTTVPPAFSDSISQDTVKESTSPQLKQEQEKVDIFKDLYKIEIVPDAIKEIKSRKTDHTIISYVREMEKLTPKKTNFKKDPNNSPTKMQSPQKNENLDLKLKKFFNDLQQRPVKSKSKTFDLVSRNKLINKEEQKLDASKVMNVFKREEKKAKDITRPNLDSNDTSSVKNITASSDKVSSATLQETETPSTLNSPSLNIADDKNKDHSSEMKKDPVEDGQAKNPCEKLEITLAKDDKEKTGDISFPGITPLPFYSAGVLENAMKELETIDDKNKKDLNININKEIVVNSSAESPPIPKELESNQEKVLLNCSKVEEANKPKALTNSEQSISNVEGKAINPPIPQPLVIKKQPEKPIKNTIKSHPKIEGFKKAIYEKPAKEKFPLSKRETSPSAKEKFPLSKRETSPSGKERLSPLDSLQTQLNNDKITNILKEHRRLLELLLEKVNSRMLASNTHDICHVPERLKKDVKEPDKKRQENKEADKTSCENVSENIKKILSSNPDLQEKIKRLHPRKNDKVKAVASKIGDFKDNMDIIGPTPINFEGKKFDFKSRDVKPSPDNRANNVSIYKPKPFKRFNVFTMMTSPSGKCLTKKSNEPLIDGSKLAKYHYSPLKQILSQYGVDSTVKSNHTTTTTRKLSLFASPGNKRVIIDKPEKKPNCRSISYTTYLSIRGKNDRAKIKSKLAQSQVKKINMVNKKKNYKIKDNVKNQHIDLKSSSQVEIVSTLQKITKASKKSKSVEQNTKVEGSEAVVKPEDNNLKLSKGVFFDSIKREFHKSTNSKPKLFLEKAKAGVTKAKVKTRSLSDAKGITFVTRPCLLANAMFKSGLETRPNIYNVGSSKQMVEGPRWIVSTEYTANPIQWNTSANSKVEAGNAPAQKSAPSTLSLLASLTKKMFLPKIISASSKSLQRSLNVPVLASSAIPISTDILKYKTYSRNKTEPKKVEKNKTKNKAVPTLYQVGKEYENEHLQTLAEPETSSFTTVTNKGKLTKMSKAEYKPKILNIDPKSNLLKSHVNSSNYKVYSRNYLRFNPSKLSSATSKEKPKEKLDDPPPCRHCKEIQDKSKELLTLKPLQKSLSKITKMSDPYNTKVYLNETLADKLNLPSFRSMKISWSKITSKVKSLIKSKRVEDDHCCVPDFDQLMMSISNDMDKKQFQKRTRPTKNKRKVDFDHVKHIRSKELFIIHRKNIKKPRFP